MRQNVSKQRRWGMGRGAPRLFSGWRIRLIASQCASETANATVRRERVRHLNCASETANATVRRERVRHLNVCCRGCSTILSTGEPFSRREAWRWLVAEAAWKPRASGAIAPR